MLIPGIRFIRLKFLVNEKLFNFRVELVQMDLQKEILAEHSKASCNKIVRWVGNSQERFDELFGLFLRSEYRINQRAAWPISYCVIDHPNLIQQHFSQLVNNLDKPGLHDSIKRNSMRLLQHVDIPTRFHGKVMDKCFQY